MSLVIALKGQNSIVVGADTRTTEHRSDGSVRYLDNTKKVIVKKDYVVTMCGDNKVGNEFVYDILDSLLSKDIDKRHVPLTILNLFSKEYKDCDISFFVTYYDEQISYIYRIESTNGTIESVNHESFGGGFGGCTNIASAMLGSLDYANLNEKCLVELVKSVLQATFDSYKYRKEAVVGGKMDIVVVKPTSIEVVMDSYER